MGSKECFTPVISPRNEGFIVWKDYLGEMSDTILKQRGNIIAKLTGKDSM